jgi:hypothetical protein
VADDLPAPILSTPIPTTHVTALAKREGVTRRTATAQERLDTACRTRDTTCDAAADLSKKLLLRLQTALPQTSPVNVGFRRKVVAVGRAESNRETLVRPERCGIAAPRNAH